MTESSNDHPAGDVIDGLLGYSLKRSYLIVRGAADEALAEYDLRVVPFTALSLIVDHPGIAPSEIAAALAMERSNIVVIIDQLETRDLIERRPSQTDRRRLTLFATIRGRRLRDRAATDVEAAERTALTALSEDEQRTLMQLLARVTRGSGKETATGG